MLLKHPKLGASWEGFALEQVIRYYLMPSNRAYFWRTQAGAELDLLLHIEGEKVGFEFKYGENIKATRSMHVAIEDLKLAKLVVVHPGERSFSLTPTIEVRGIAAFAGKA